MSYYPRQEGVIAVINLSIQSYYMYASYSYVIRLKGLEYQLYYKKDNSLHYIDIYNTKGEWIATLHS